MKAYKGFQHDMTCRGFQYKEGETYEEKKASVCECGFHACENPIDCLEYYNASQSLYHEVELDGDIDRSDDDTKVSATKIKIGARLDIPALCHAAFEYVRSKCMNENNAEAGKPATAGEYGAATAGYKGAATAGEYGAATAGDHGAATAGECGAATAGYKGAATAGEYGAATAGYKGAATAGEYGAATAGNCGAATAGNCGAATAGYKGAATAGECGAATAGEYGAATAGEYGAATSKGSVKVGDYGVGTVRAEHPKIMGGNGAMLTIARESETSNDIIEWKSFVIDGQKFKADVWYTLYDGKIKEV